MTGGKLGTNIDEQTTPSLMENGEESDSEGDEANTLDYLDEYIGSLTNDETDEILQGFETYIQHHHNDDSTVAEAAKNPSDNVGSSTKTPDVASFSSIRKWLQCRSTSDSVEGVRFNNVFEPSARYCSLMRVSHRTIDAKDWDKARLHRANKAPGDRQQI
eukprot:jgi/Psemu1/23178/gm1.23178_g